MKAVWCDKTLVEAPFDFCLCVCEKQYYRELKRLEIPEDMWSDFTLAGTRATVHRYTRTKGQPIALVCIRPTREKTLFQMHAVLVHEAVHLWQWTKELLGEDKPSDEFEAYGIQAMSQRLFYAYEELTKKRKS